MTDLFYLYGVIKKQSGEPFTTMRGIDGEHMISTVDFSSCSAVICPVPEAEYGEDVLKQKTNDIEWVQEKAFHHHETLLQLREKTTIIPMKFGTIFQTEESLEAMITSHEGEWDQLLTQLEDKEEWNIKIYCNRTLLHEEVAENNLKIKSRKEEIKDMSKGMQYLQKKKLDQLIDEEVEREQLSFSKALHEELNLYSTDEAVKKVWNKDVTGKEDEMCWNSAYLLPIKEVEPFLEKVTAANEKWGASGWKVEVTGPWPAYHFVELSLSGV